MKAHTVAPSRPRPADATHPGTRPAPRRPGAPGTARRSSWRVPATLAVLSAIPVVAGSLRLVEIAGGPHLLTANPRIAASPLPVVIHIVGATFYALAGAFQFSASFRRHRPGWHRTAGRVLIGAGLAVAGSALWMTLFYAGAPGGNLLWTVRLLVASTMAGAIVFGFAAVRRRDIAAHRAWMIRAYALALGAGTQTVTQGVGQAVFGTGELSTALSISAGWVVNAAVAEWIIRRPGARRRRRAAVGGSR
jgi:Predicted membrane protein (DUF2306)